MLIQKISCHSCRIIRTKITVHQATVINVPTSVSIWVKNSQSDFNIERILISPFIVKSIFQRRPKIWQLSKLKINFFAKLRVTFGHNCFTDKSDLKSSKLWRSETGSHGSSTHATPRLVGTY